MERVLHVVEVADLEVPVHLIELLRRQHHVLHLGTPHAFDPHVELPAGERLRHDADQLRSAQQIAVHLDDEAQDVLAVEEDRTGIGERQFARGDRGQRRTGIHDERIPARPGEDAHAVPRAALLVVHRERNGLAGRGDAGAFLLHALPTGGCRRRREEAVEDEFLRGDGEGDGVGLRSLDQRAKSEAVDQPVGQPIPGLGEGEGVHREHEVPRSFRAGERVDVRDVRDRFGQGSRP